MLEFNNLLTSHLQGVADTDVVVSRVSIPPNMVLPKHWHPGEEFAYVLEGTVVLWQEDKPEKVFKPGDVFVVPLKQVHTVKTLDEAAKALVFRVHEQGQPERILVEES